MKIIFPRDAGMVKTLGRAFSAEDGFCFDYTCSGVEFCAECEGEITLTCTAGIAGYLAVFVDGMRLVRSRIEPGRQTLLLTAGLPAGMHTVRILRDSDMDTAGSHLVFHSIELSAKKVSAPPARDMFIEFVGDSITTGKGCLRIHGAYKPDDTCHSATHSFAYLTAEALGADFSMVARGGMGLVRRTQYMSRVAQEIYPYKNGFAGTEKYGFPRAADVAVICLGPNDGDYPAADIKEQIKNLTLAVRAANGEKTKIILLYGMMLDILGKEFRDAARELGGAEKNYYTLGFSKNTDGSHSPNGTLGHPSAAAHRRFASELAEFIRKIR